MRAWLSLQASGARSSTALHAPARALGSGAALQGSSSTLPARAAAAAAPLLRQARRTVCAAATTADAETFQYQAEVGAAVGASSCWLGKKGGGQLGRRQAGNCPPACPEASRVGWQ